MRFKKQEKNLFINMLELHKIGVEKWIKEFDKILDSEK
jgi:hypothetical protein